MGHRGPSSFLHANSNFGQYSVLKLECSLVVCTEPIVLSEKPPKTVLLTYFFHFGKNKLKKTAYEVISSKNTGTY